jgi:hypothetical protein
VSYGLGALYSPPIRVNGEVLRGVFTSNGPGLQQVINRDNWVVLHCDHGAFPPPADRPDVDLFQIDKYFNEDAQRKGLRFVNVIFRDFTDENIYKPIEIEKTFDVIYNACWYSVKRHNLVLDALMHAKQAGRPISCLFYGYHWQGAGVGTERRIEERTKRVISQFKLDAKVVSTNWDGYENNKRFNTCRVCLLCSTTEAGPRVLPEACLANLPYISTNDTVGGSVAYINERNGRLCSPTPQSIAEAVWDVLDRIDSFKPREWALENMCKQVSEVKLAEALTQLEHDKGWKINKNLGWCGSGIASNWAHQVIEADKAI